MELNSVNTSSYNHSYANQIIFKGAKAKAVPIKEFIQTGDQKVEVGRVKPLEQK